MPKKHRTRISQSIEIPKNIHPEVSRLLRHIKRLNSPKKGRWLNPPSTEHDYASKGEKKVLEDGRKRFLRIFQEEIVRHFDEEKLKRPNAIDKLEAIRAATKNWFLNHDPGRLKLSDDSAKKNRLLAIIDELNNPEKPRGISSYPQVYPIRDKRTYKDAVLDNFLSPEDINILKIQGMSGRELTWINAGIRVPEKRLRLFARRLIGDPTGAKAQIVEELRKPKNKK